MELCRRPDEHPGLSDLGSNHSNQRKLSMPRMRKQSQIIPPEGNEAAAAIYAVIRRIPRGWVATYGQVAAMAGLPRRARLVGQVLQHLGPATDIPWHRVVNAKGEVSYALSRNGGDALQQRLLEKEGVEFDNRNRFDLERFRWPE
jgi:methylated-DNA-protein-cysteine methyltransferase-like protein